VATTVLMNSASLTTRTVARVPTADSGILPTSGPSYSRPFLLKELTNRFSYSGRAASGHQNCFRSAKWLVFSTAPTPVLVNIFTWTVGIGWPEYCPAHPPAAAAVARLQRGQLLLQLRVRLEPHNAHLAGPPALHG
jgi:hypothetical protein